MECTDGRFVKPTFGSQYNYPGEQFFQIRCGPPLHLAIHDGVTTDSLTIGNVNEKDEFGNSALHVVAIVAYNTGHYTEMQKVIVLLQSLGIEKNSVNNNGDTVLALFDRMIKKATADAEDPWGKSYDSRMFYHHASHLIQLRDMFLN